MEAEAAGGQARAAEGGNHAQVLGDRLAAELELRTMSEAYMTSSAIFVWTLARTAALPPPWVSRARETGEQLLRAHLFEYLYRFGLVHAAAIAIVLCIYHLGAAPAECALPAVRLLFSVVLVSTAGEYAVVISNSWGETALWFAVVVASAAITVRPWKVQGVCPQDP